MRKDDMKDTVKGRKGISALAFLRPFPQAAVLREDAVIKGVARLVGPDAPGVYLVGGAVRNVSIGVPPAPDYDFAIEGDVMKLARGAARRFKGTAFLLDKETLAYRVVVKPGRTRHGVVLDFSPVKGGGITEDLRARDFTVNAVGVSLAGLFAGEASAIDPARGLEDAKKRVLRVTSPGVFDADPLRVLRAIRLSYWYGLKIASPTLALMKAKAGLLRDVAVERVRDELVRIFSSPGTPSALGLAWRCGVVEAVLPEVAPWADIGGYNLKAHSLRTLAEAERIMEGINSGEYLASQPRLRAYLSGSVASLGRATLFKFAAFLHDAGKAATLSRETGRLRFIGHDRDGAAIVKDTLSGLKFSRRAVGWLARLVAEHHRTFMLAALDEPSPRARAHFFRAAGGEAGVALLLLALADASATRGAEDEELLRTVDKMLTFYYTTYTKKKPGPLLDGREIMKTFKVAEGKAVGEISRMISRGVEQGEVNNKKDAIRYVTERLKS